ncbi:MAG TPA: SRPBCC family protein, partial [Armatimonadota bacterium]|nr:SRPBCC family protein [Armatimonadota bacterium]
SLGLGLAGLVAPREVARFIGVPDDDRTRDLLRTVGAREVISGLGILTQPRPTGWVWSRVAGDVMDLALLSSARGAPGVHRDRLATATAAVAGITALDLYAGQELSRAPVGEAERARRRHWQGDSQRAKSITVNRSPEEVYGYWRDFRNLARFMKNVLSVEETGDRRTHWRVRGPAGSVVEWDAEIVEDRPGELIAWRSLPGSEVHHCGRVRFRPAPGDRGTEIHVEMEYAPPGGAIGETVAFLFGKDPRQQLGEDLRRFKQVLETGEVVVSEGSINGIQFPQHAGQPPTEEDLARSEWRRAA